MIDIFSRETIPSTGPSPRLVRLGDLVDELREDAAAAHDARVNGTPRGPMTNLERFDRELGGFLSPGLHVLHAGPGVGKTALGLQIAADCRAPALLVSTEMR